METRDLVYPEDFNKVQTNDTFFSFCKNLKVYEILQISCFLHLMTPDDLE